MKKENIQELLLRSFEQPLPAEERARLDAALAGSEALQREKQQLEKLRFMLGSLQEEPNRSFTDEVMARLNTSPVEATLLSLLPKAAAACLAIILLTLVGIYIAEGSLSADAIIGVSGLSPEDAYTYLEY